MKAKALASSALCLVALTGCQTIYPIVPRWTEEDIQKVAQKDPLLSSSPSEALAKVRGVRSLLAAAADRRRTTELAASEVAYYGTLMGVIGLSLDKQGLINTGGGALGLGTLFTGRYRLGDQAVAFRKAEARVACIEEALSATQGAGAHGLMASATLSSAISSSNVSIAKQAGAQAYVTQANALEADIPGVTTSTLRSVINDLRIALAGFTLTPMTQEQMKAVLDGAVGKKEAAAKALADASGDGEAARVVAAQTVAVLTYKDQVAACLVQHPQ